MSLYYIYIIYVTDWISLKFYDVRFCTHHFYPRNCCTHKSTQEGPNKFHGSRCVSPHGQGGGNSMVSTTDLLPNEDFKPLDLPLPPSGALLGASHGGIPAKLLDVFGLRRLRHLLRRLIAVRGGRTRVARAKFAEAAGRAAPALVVSSCKC